MNDVLTKEERAFAEKLRDHVSITGRVHGKSAAALAIIDRLVAEVERLRARNEALEKLAKAAGEDHRYHTRPESDECAVCASLTALSAINHPTTLDGSGGGT